MWAPWLHAHRCRSCGAPAPRWWTSAPWPLHTLDCNTCLWFRLRSWFRSLGGQPSCWISGPARHVSEAQACVTLAECRAAQGAFSDLAPFVALTLLQSLNCEGCDVADLGPLAACTQMRNLNCAFSLVMDLAPLAACTLLQTLNCRGCRVVSGIVHAAAGAELRVHGSEGPGPPGWLHGAADAEVRLVQSGQPGALGCVRITGDPQLATLVRDLTPLAAFTHLQVLNCWCANVASLGPLMASSTSLVVVRCNSTPVADLAPLAACTQLMCLECQATGVADLSPLAGCKELSRLLCPEAPLTRAAAALEATCGKRLELKDYAGYWEYCSRGLVVVASHAPAPAGPD